MDNKELIMLIADTTNFLRLGHKKNIILRWSQLF